MNFIVYMISKVNFSSNATPRSFITFLVLDWCNLIVFLYMIHMTFVNMSAKRYYFTLEMFNFNNQLSLHCFKESIPDCKKQLSLRICRNNFASSAKR